MNPFASLMLKLRGEPSYNDTDQDYRVAEASMPATNTPDHHASTFIRNISYSPNRHTAFVTIGNRQYWYPMTDYQMAAWLRSRSLGKYYNDNIKLKR